MARIFCSISGDSGLYFALFVGSTADHIVFLAKEINDRGDCLREDLSQVDFVACGKDCCLVCLAFLKKFLNVLDIFDYDLFFNSSIKVFATAAEAPDPPRRVLISLYSANIAFLRAGFSIRSRISVVRASALQSA